MIKEQFSVFSSTHGIEIHLLTFCMTNLSTHFVLRPFLRVQKVHPARQRPPYKLTWDDAKGLYPRG